jgi:P4 family phage/plasmid primase-like protien
MLSNHGYNKGAELTTPVCNAISLNTVSSFTTCVKRTIDKETNQACVLFGDEKQFLFYKKGSKTPFIWEHGKFYPKYNNATKAKKNNAPLFDPDKHLMSFENAKKHQNKEFGISYYLKGANLSWIDCDNTFLDGTQIPRKFFKAILDKAEEMKSAVFYSSSMLGHHIPVINDIYLEPTSNKLCNFTNEDIETKILNSEMKLKHPGIDYFSNQDRHVALTLKSYNEYWDITLKVSDILEFYNKFKKPEIEAHKGKPYTDPDTEYIAENVNIEDVLSDFLDYTEPLDEKGMSPFVEGNSPSLERSTVNHNKVIDYNPNCEAGVSITGSFKLIDVIDVVRFAKKISMQEAKILLRDTYLPDYKLQNEGRNRYYNKNGTLIPNLLVKVLIADHKILNINGRFYIYDDGVYKRFDKTNMAKFISGYLKPTKTSRQVNEVMEQLSWDTWENVNNINTNKQIINLKNCVIEVSKDTFEIKEHSPEYKTTIQYPINYNQEAFCEVWQKFLNDVLATDQQLILQEVFGYMLTLNNRAKKFFLLHGAPDSGKSLALKILAKIIGGENTSSLELKKITNNDSRFYTSKLFQKVANICGDITGNIEDTGTLKLLTGDDRITGEEKGKEPFEFYNFARLIFSCNKLPNNYSDKTKAFYNRLLLVDFPVSIPKDKQDPDLENKFNLEGVLNWALEGAKRIFNNGLQFTISQTNIEKLEAYEMSNNSVLSFTKEACRTDKDGAVKDLYEGYQWYCQSSGFRSIGRNKFIEELKNLGYRYTKHIKNGNKQDRGFIGLHRDKTD